MTAAHARIAHCVSGCTQRGQHLDDCADERCGGCLPRPAAEQRAVCERCDSRTVEALSRIPDLVVHVRSLVEPSLAGTLADRVSGGSREAPAPLNVNAVADADDLHAMVAAWIEKVIDEHPAGLVGPPWVGSRVLAASKRRHDQITDTDGRPVLVYDQPRVAGLTAEGWDATTHLVTWLLPHLPWALAQADWADDLVAVITTEHAKVAARWPTEERPQHLAAPCPKCDRLTLTRYAPSCYLGPVTISCRHPDCGEPVPPDKYDFYSRVLASSAGAVPRARPVGTRPTTLRFAVLRTYQAGRFVPVAVPDTEDQPDGQP